MPVTITHVSPVTALVTLPATAPPDPDPLALECGVQALRHTLWVSLFLSQQLRLADFQHDLSRLLRNIDRLRAELEIA